MAEGYNQTSLGYLESRSTHLADQLKQAINNGEAFSRAKKIYRKLKKVKKQISAFTAHT